MKFKKFCRKLKYNKKIALSVVALFLVSLMSVGFAYMSQKLEVKATVNVYNKFSVRVVSVVVSEMTNGGVTQYNPNYNKLDVSTTSTLPNLDSTITYKISIKNYSMSVAAKLESIIEKSISNENVDYTLSIKEGDLINSNSTTDVYLTIKYKDTTTVLPSDINTGVELEFKFIENEDDLYGKYADGDMLLNLRGVDEPVNDVWYDKENGYAMKLNNVDYDSKERNYVFKGSSSATVGKAIIPQTGDFTLEARITYPTNIRKVIDQSIVAQVSDTSNDTGRFKIDAQYRQYQNQLLTFFNDLKGGTNAFVIHAVNPTLGGTFVTQVVRSGNKLSVYLDGVFVTSYDFNAESPISTGPFKLGTWNDASTQYYTGNISAVRVYSRGLSDEELLNNKEVDDKMYAEIIEPDPTPTPPTEKTLREYAIAHQIVTEGEGLYLDNLDNYVYRGVNVNNYLKFNGDSDIYKIISFNTDNTMKIINITQKFNQAFDESGNRSFETSTYCSAASKVANASLNQMYGCNAWQKADSLSIGSSTGNVLNDSSSNIYLNTIYYNSMPSFIKEKVITHDFYIGYGIVNQSRNDTNLQSLTTKWNGNIGMITVSDVMNANVTNVNVSNAQTKLSNYLIKMTNSSSIYWTMTPANANTWDVYAMTNGTSFGKRRASRYDYMESGVNSIMYAIPSFYTDSLVENYKGTGTSDDPFIIG